MHFDPDFFFFFFIFLFMRWKQYDSQTTADEDAGLFEFILKRYN